MLAETGQWGENGLMPDLPRTLSGRGGECATLDGVLEGVRGGRSAALVVRGEAGIGLPLTRR